MNHHGPQVYQPRNNGLPFGPHPHRGFETVTFILEGDILHKDSSGHESVIEAGGIQWMTAGSGLIHAEVSSNHFKQTGGPLEILQLWVNLPARYKMTEPRYIGLQQREIPTATPADGVTLHVVSGSWGGTAGPVHPLADVALAWADFSAGAVITLPVAASRSIFFYVVRGSVRVNGTEAFARELVEFNYDGEELAIEALTDSVLLLGHAQPFGEPVVSAGPFVMNTEGEIRQAYADYQQGKFGSWNG
ncbi:pirin family protein [Hymenobacter sp. BRD67]|uniref:pirin family protein n=1 Tax=Hymenobacter sp. BRD67 TaxID=2675877 RepID=UPI00293C1387|nr:pirin family protein [Hymenobacter sp. BRD67]